MHGVQNYNKTEAKNIVAEVECPPLPPTHTHKPPPMTFERVDELFESCSQRDREQES